MCKKKEKDTPVPPQQNASMSPPEIAAKMPGSWIWDSTCLCLDDSLKYTYTSTKLISYLTGTTTILCNTHSTFTLNINNQPFNSQSNGLGYTNSYSDAMTNWQACRNKLSIKGTGDLTDSTQIVLDETWGWMVFPGENDVDVYIFFSGTGHPQHQGISYTAYLTFVGMTYQVKNISDHVLQLTVKDITFNHINTSKIYFHK